MKTAFTILSFIFLLTGTYFLAKEISAVADAHFIPYSFDKAIFLYFLAGLIAAIINSSLSKWSLFLSVIAVLIAGGWVYYHILFVGHDLGTFFFYQFEHAIVTWLLPAFVFFRKKIFRKGYVFYFLIAMCIYVVLWLSGFTFGNFHENAICSTLVWGFMGSVVLIYSVFVLFNSAPVHSSM